MAKRKVIRRINKTLNMSPINLRTKKYDIGGSISLGNTVTDISNSPIDTSKLTGLAPKAGLGNLLGAMGPLMAVSALGGTASAIGSGIGSAISGGKSSGAGNVIDTIGDIGGSIPIVGGFIKGATGIVSGITNSLFGSKLNKENISKIEGENKALNTLMVDNSSNDSILNQWSNQDFGSSFSRKDIGSDGLFSNKAKHKYKKLKKQQGIARNRALTSYENAADAADTQSDLNAMANFAAFGGPLGIWGGYGSGAIGYELAKENLGIKALNAANKGKLTSLPNSFESSELNTFAKGGKIHIKPENRGKFTKYCGGKVTSECIARGKRSSDPAVRKRATFAANARKWHHTFGGDLLTHGAEWDNGLRIIGNGGTHEENPFEGVQMGVDNQGIPNLVEEGEVIFNDYVYSNRIKVPKEVKKKYKLRGDTFADLAENAQKESKERPNDPISQRGLNDIMTKLAMEQETIRAVKNRGQGNKYPFGGLMAPYYNAPEDTMWDPMSNSSVYTGDPLDIIYGESKPYRFGAGVTPSGEWVEEPKNMARAAAKRAGYNVRTSLEDYNENPIANPDYKEGKSNNKSGPTWLRYAPVLGSTIGLAQNIFSSPDYSSADAILEAANQAGNYTPVGYTPIGNYLQYRPFDRNFYLNKLNAQAGATRRAIMNTTSPSRNAALLAADYNAQGRLGDLARQAEEYNLAQRQAVETFNRGTNMANAEMGLKAAMANQEAALKARSSRLSGVAQAMAVRDAVDARRGASMSANLTNLFNSLGDVGREKFSRNMIMSNPALYYSIDSKGNITYKNGYENLSEAEKAEVRDTANRDSKSKKKAKSGYLTISNRRRKR